MSDETEGATPTGSAVRRAARESRLGRLGERTVAAVRDSFLYRWLTAEPDPEVIVIDLRETWTVGPFIRLLDAVLDRVLPALEESRLATAVRAAARRTRSAPAVVGGLAVVAVGLLLALGSVAAGTLGTTRLGLAAVLTVAGVISTRERRSWAELRETRPVELLIAALEPPEPPDDAGPDRAAAEAAGDATGDNATGDDATGDNATGDDATGDNATGDDATADDADATGAETTDRESAADGQSAADR